MKIAKIESESQYSRPVIGPLYLPYSWSPGRSAGNKLPTRASTHQGLANQGSSEVGIVT